MAVSIDQTGASKMATQTDEAFGEHRNSILISCNPCKIAGATREVKLKVRRETDQT
jgi:hypothetical protein